MGLETDIQSPIWEWAEQAPICGSTVYLEGQGDLVTRLIMGIIGVTIWVIGVINLLTKSP